jgi:hypothetical protein
MDVQYTDRMAISSTISQFEFKMYNYSANIFIMIPKCRKFTADCDLTNDIMQKLAAYNLSIHNYFYVVVWQSTC